MTVSRLLRLGLVALLGLALLAGCGDDDDTAEDTTEDAADDTTEDTADDMGDEATEDTADDAPTADVTEPVTTAFTAFFGEFDVAHLEDGDTFTEKTIADLKQRLAAAGGASVNVNTVTALADSDCDGKGVAAPCAEVNYDLVVDGNPALPGQTGFAVEQDGAWKVAKTTFCTLASLSGSTPEGC